MLELSFKVDIYSFDLNWCDYWSDSLGHNGWSRFFIPILELEEQYQTTRGRKALLHCASGKKKESEPFCIEAGLIVCFCSRLSRVHAPALCLRSGSGATHAKGQRCSCTRGCHLRRRLDAHRAVGSQDSEPNANHAADALDRLLYLRQAHARRSGGRVSVALSRGESGVNNSSNRSDPNMNFEDKEKNF